MKKEKDPKTGEAMLAAGKDPVTGKFLKGHRYGKLGGSPTAIAVGRHRQIMLACVTEEDTIAVIRKLVECAKKGEGWAIKEFCDRLLGKAHQTIEAAITTTTTPEETATRIKEFFGLSN